MIPNKDSLEFRKAIYGLRKLSTKHLAAAKHSQLTGRALSDREVKQSVERLQKHFK